MSEGVDLDGEVRRVDPDRWLATRFIGDRGARGDVIALYAFDHELARAKAVASTPLIAAVRLTWWREAIDEIFSGRAVRGHPTLAAVATAVRSRDLPREAFEAMIEAHLAAVEVVRFDSETAVAWATGAQGRLAGLAARMLDGGSAQALAEPAGVVWGLIQLRRAGSVERGEIDPHIRRALNEARGCARRLSARALPAALAATLARGELGPRAPSELAKRLRLTWAALSGRL